MSNIGSALSAEAQLLLSKVAAAAQTSMVTNFGGLVATLSADAVGLVGQEAEDFGNLVTDFVQGVEAKKGWLVSFEAASAKFVKAEASQLYQDAVTLVGQVADMFHNAVTEFEKLL